MVRARHEEIQKIERDLIELAQLFTDLDTIVVQQDPATVQIEQQGEVVHENVTKANAEITGAIDKARARNRKKWWCLLIVGKSFPPCAMWNPALTCQQLSSSLSLPWRWVSPLVSRTLNLRLPLSTCSLIMICILWNRHESVPGSIVS